MTSKTKAKRNFREIYDDNLLERIIFLDDIKLKFKGKSGLVKFAELRVKKELARGGFRMPSLPELSHLIYASFNNLECSSSQEVIDVLKDYHRKITGTIAYVTGNTAVLPAKEGMYVQDNPLLKNGRIFMNRKELKERLGSHEEKGVVFSDDRTIRFVSYGFEVGFSLGYEELADNPGIVALFGGQRNAKKIARSSKYLECPPEFFSMNHSLLKKPDNEPRLIELSIYDHLYQRSEGLKDYRYYSDFGQRMEIGMGREEGYYCTFGVSDIE